MALRERDGQHADLARLVKGQDLGRMDGNRVYLAAQEAGHAALAQGDVTKLEACLLGERRSREPREATRTCATDLERLRFGRLHEIGQRLIGGIAPDDDGRPLEHQAGNVIPGAVVIGQAPHGRAGQDRGRKPADLVPVGRRGLDVGEADGSARTRTVHGDDGLPEHFLGRFRHGAAGDVRSAAGLEGDGHLDRLRRVGRRGGRNRHRRDDEGKCENQQILLHGVSSLKCARSALSKFSKFMMPS